MSKHRVDINVSGMSHYVDGQLHGTSGFTQLPDGLHLERRVGAPTNKTKKFVRKLGVGRSIEWTSNRDPCGAQAGQHRAAPPPGHPRGRGPGPQRGEQPEQAFDVSEGNSEDGDAHSRAHSRRDEPIIVNYQYHNRHPRRYNTSDRATRATSSIPVASYKERRPRVEFDELFQWERDHGFANYQDHNGYDGLGHAGRAMRFVPGHSNRRDLPLWFEDVEYCQWERNHRSWR